MKDNNFIKEPSFFCVGAAKSGTSALHYFLGQHPDIFMPEIKEIHHFAPDILSKNDYWLDNEKYFSLFKNALPHQIIGETSAFYLLSEEAATNILQYNSLAKIIILLRSPVEFIHSLHSQLVFNGEENITNLEDALDAETNRLQGIDLPISRIQEKHLYTKAAKYYRQVKRFTDIFDEENIKIVLYDDFKTNLKESIKDIYEFIGVDKSFIPNIKSVNSNKKIRSRHLQKINKKITDKILTPSIGFDTAQKISKKVIKLNSKFFKREEMSEQTKIGLVKILESDIKQLEKLINMDLSNWYKI